MGLDGTLSVVDPNTDEDIFYLSNSSRAIHHFIIATAAERDEEKEKRMREQNVCELTLEQAFNLEELLRTIAENEKAYLDGIDEESGWKEDIYNVQYYTAELQRVLLEYSQKIIFWGLNKNFVYFEYVWS